ncbi:MAG: hypothetical protein JSV70_06450 [bacterium]|nr:MAG: hypothetical protein JSV70_06450 [bacterium]
MTLRTLNPFLVTIIAFIAAGCIAVPTPAKHRVRGQTFVDAPEILVPGKTTKEEVLASFGLPTAVWEDEDVWIYGWDQSRSGWFVVAPGGDFGYLRNWKDKICLIRYDARGVLSDSKIGDRPGLSDTGRYLMDWIHGEGSRESNSLAVGSKKVPVLMRLVTNTDGRLDDDPRVKWFDSRLQGVAVRLGGFGTGGLIRERGIKKREKIGKNLWYEGWQLYYVEPGDLYLAFFHVSEAFPSPSGYVDGELSMPPIIHADIPVSDIPVYIGSFHFDRRTTVEASWSRNAQFEDYRFVGIVDERGLALRAAAEILQVDSELHTTLPNVHDGPAVIGAPLDLR